MARYKAPAGETGINIGGQQFNADANGEIELPDDGGYVLPEGYQRASVSLPAPDAAPPEVLE